MVYTCNPGIQDAETELSLGYIARFVSNKNKIHQLKKNSERNISYKTKIKTKRESSSSNKITY